MLAFVSTWLLFLAFRKRNLTHLQRIEYSFPLFLLPNDRITSKFRIYRTKPNKTAKAEKTTKWLFENSGHWSMVWLIVLNYSGHTKEYLGNIFALNLLHARFKLPEQRRLLRAKGNDVLLLMSPLTHPASIKILSLKFRTHIEHVEYYMNVRLRCDDEQLIILQRID